MGENAIQDMQQVELPLANRMNESNKLTIEYQEEEQVLQVYWEGRVTSQEVRQGYSRIMELVKQHRPAKWLFDLSQRALIKREDQRWVFSNVFPQALQMLQQTVFVAVVLPVYSYHSLVNELEGDELMQGENFLIINHFLYPEEAQRWLSNMAQLGQASA